MDAACRDALDLQLLAVTAHVLQLGQRVAAGDLAAAAEVEALAALINVQGLKR